MNCEEKIFAHEGISKYIPSNLDYSICPIYVVEGTAFRQLRSKMAASWQGGSHTRICLAAALAGSVGLALYYGYRKRVKSQGTSESEDKKGKDEEKREENGISDSNTTLTDDQTKDVVNDEGYAIKPVTENVEPAKEEPKGFSEKTEDSNTPPLNKTAELNTSLTESTFSVLGDEKDDKNEKVESKDEQGDSSSKDSQKDSIPNDENKEALPKVENEDISPKDDIQPITADKEKSSHRDDIVVVDDIVVIEESQQSHSAPPPPPPPSSSSSIGEILVPESADFTQSLPSLSDQPSSLSAFELPSLEVSESVKDPEPDSEPQSLSNYEFPSLEPEIQKPDNGSDIEVLPNEEKSKEEKQKQAVAEAAPKPAADTTGPSQIPKAKKDVKKSAAKESSFIPTASSSSESKAAEPKEEGKDTKGPRGKRQNRRKGSRESKQRDETDASTSEAAKKGKETAGKGKPPPVPPKPKQAKPEPAPKASKDQEVHIKHPAHPGEFVSLGMKFESRDKTSNHIITGVEEGGPASEVGLQNGDVLLKLNDMDVTHWSRAVLTEQFRMIPSTEFDLTVRRKDKGKHFTVHIMDQKEDSVAVSGVVMDVNNIRKPPQIVSIEAVQGSEAVEKCQLVSLTGQYAKVTDKGLMLQDKPTADDASCNFEKIAFKEGDSKVVILKADYKGSPVYITVLNRNTVGVQYESEEDATQLQAADPRCFYLMKTRSGSYWLESTQYPDHYLSYEGGRFHLVSLTQPADVATNKNIRFSFETI